MEISSNTDNCKYLNIRTIFKYYFVLFIEGLTNFDHTHFGSDEVYGIDGKR